MQAEEAGEQAQESTARDRVWASLQALRPESERLAAGQFDSSDGQRQIITALTCIIVAEMDCRTKDTSPE